MWWTYIFIHSSLSCPVFIWRLEQMNETVVTPTLSLPRVMWLVERLSCSGLDIWSDHPSPCWTSLDQINCWWYVQFRGHAAERCVWKQDWFSRLRRVRLLLPGLIELKQDSAVRLLWWKSCLLAWFRCASAPAWVCLNWDNSTVQLWWPKVWLDWTETGQCSAAAVTKSTSVHSQSLRYPQLACAPESHTHLMVLTLISHRCSDLDAPTPVIFIWCNVIRFQMDTSWLKALTLWWMPSGNAVPARFHFLRPVRGAGGDWGWGLHTWGMWVKSVIGPQGGVEGLAESSLLSQWLQRRGADSLSWQQHQWFWMPAMCQGCAKDTPRTCSGACAERPGGVRDHWRPLFWSPFLHTAMEVTPSPKPPSFWNCVLMFRVVFDQVRCTGILLFGCWSVHCRSLISLIFISRHTGFQHGGNHCFPGKNLH